MITERVQLLASKKGHTFASLERELGLGRGAIRRWDENIPSADKLYKVANFLLTTSDWLLNGIETMAANGYTAEEIELINYFRLLPDREKDRTLGNIEGKAEVYTKNTAESKQSKNNVIAIQPRPDNGFQDGVYITKKVYDQPAAAGLGNYLDDSSSYTMEDVKESEVPPKAYFGIRITGDSMEPDIKHGSIVWVEERIQIESGHIGIFILNGEALCKKLVVDQDKRKVSLVSSNKKFPPMEINDNNDLRTVGRVLIS